VIQEEEEEEVEEEMCSNTLEIQLKCHRPTKNLHYILISINTTI
jgi:hypothetical protein